MTTDLSLVTHATQRHANKLAVGGPRQGLAKRCLTNARRAYQTKHRAFQLTYALLYRQILENTLLDLFQAVVIVLQHLLGARDVVPYFAGLFPRHRRQPINVGAHDGGLGRHR